MLLPLNLLKKLHLFLFEIKLEVLIILDKFFERVLNVEFKKFKWVGLQLNHQIEKLIKQH